MSMDLIFVIIVVLSIIAYFKFIGPDGDWGIIPKPLRLVVLPLYAFTSFYIIGVLFQIGLFVPGFATVFVNLLLILFIWLTNSWFISLIAFLFAIIGDIIVGIALGAYIVFACELPIFKNEPNTTFYFRLITLIFISFIFLSSFVFDHDLGVAWYEEAIFAICVIIADIFCYLFIVEERVNQRSGSIWDRAWSLIRLFFSKSNPILLLINKNRAHG